MADVEIEVPSPLRDCFERCEVICVRDCCGIDAISTDTELIADWGRQVGPETNALALRQLGELVWVVEDRSHKVSSSFLNHYTCDVAAGRQLLDFLHAFRSVLEIVAEKFATAGRPRE
jgi:hypothetical protein